MEKEKEFLTVQEVAEKLRISVVTVRSMIKDGSLRAVRVGKKMFRIARAELEDFISRQEDEKR